MTFDRRLKDLDHRDWSELESGWIVSISRLTNLVSLPDLELVDMEEVNSLIQQVPTGQNVVQHLLTGASIRPAVFHEAVAFVMKAAHVFRATLAQFENGFATWPVVQSYQTAFFASRAYVGLLGVTYVNFNSQVYLIDVWPSPTGKNKSSKRKTLAESDQIKILKLGTKRVEHRHHWGLVSRLSGTSRGLDSIERLQRVCKKLDDKDFSKQRSSVHYRASAWIYSDIMSQLKLEVITDQDKFVEQIVKDEEILDFSLILGSLFLQGCLCLLRKLGKGSTIVQSVCSEIDELISQSIVVGSISERVYRACAPPQIPQLE